MEWKELTKKDAQQSLAMELEKLLLTAPECQRKELQQEFDGFRSLFNKFIHETGPSVHWDRIEKLPHDAVSSFNLPRYKSVPSLRLILDSSELSNQGS